MRRLSHLVATTARLGRTVLSKQHNPINNSNSWWLQNLRSVKIQHCTNSCYSTMATQSKSALVLLAEGAEEMEFTIIVDVLRRAAVNVTVAGLEEKANPVVCSRKVMCVPDVPLSKVAKTAFDVIILPGGLGGANKMAESSAVGELLRAQEASGRCIAAICAAPTVLKVHGIAKGKRLTSYPAMKEKMVENGYCTYVEERVVEDGQFVTSRGPGTAFEFALKLVERLVDVATRKQLESAMLLQ